MLTDSEVESEAYRRSAQARNHLDHVNSLGGMIFNRCRKLSRPMMKENVSSSHIIQMYTLRKGALEVLVCLVTCHNAIATLMSVSAQTTDATTMSVLLIGSFL